MKDDLKLLWLHHECMSGVQGCVEGLHSRRVIRGVAGRGVQGSGPPSQLQVHFFKWPKSDEFFCWWGVGVGIWV